ncbi:hypothetical protein DY000_02015280 [Brassica cretica]|uniref:Uncharacterized protein n=1 Tax=Brassica cretica TaxID=69181 RepID=A0ABQ7CZN4_BRACR|nr:hypothetical protein DY000_02015280 [Brassica cretica]
MSEASVAEDYEAGGGLVDDEDYDGWVATHMVLRLFDHGKTKAYDRLHRLLISLEQRRQREASVAEDYEAGGGLVDDEDYDGWVATHVRLFDEDGLEVV